MQNSHQEKMKTNQGHAKPYTKLVIMAVLSFISMYALMYSMVNSLSNVIPNVNQFYMAALMTMPMVIIEVTLMGSMYMNKKRNAAIIALSAVALIVFFLFIQRQTAVTDKQFLKSMIPHHGAAILMSEQSASKDPEIRKLQQEIISSQREEIRIMKEKLKGLNK